MKRPSFQRDGWGVYHIEVTQTTYYTIAAPSLAVAEEYAEDEGAYGLSFDQPDISVHRCADLDNESELREVSIHLDEDGNEVCREMFLKKAIGKYCRFCGTEEFQANGYCINDHRPPEPPCRATLPLFQEAV